VVLCGRFPLRSRRVLLRDVPVEIRPGLMAYRPETEAHIMPTCVAAETEHIMAKSLFCAGTTWPGVFLAEDQRALDVLCARDDVDLSASAARVIGGGCAPFSWRTTRAYAAPSVWG